MPRAVQSSLPVPGSYAATRRWLLTINSSRSPVVITTAVPHPTLSRARRLPDRLTGRLVERADERRLPRRGIRVLVDEDAILVEHRRARRPVIVVDDAELVLPDDLAVEVEREQAVAAERRVDQLPVGRWRGRRKSVLVVHVLDAGLRDERLPQLLAVAARIRQHRQPLAVAVAGGEEDAIAPDNRRRVAAAGHGGLPHAGGRRPLVGILRRRRRGPARTDRASAASISPLRPTTSTIRTSARRRQARNRRNAAAATSYQQACHGD